MKYEQLLNETNPIVKMIMANGDEMDIELFPTIAPLSVKNFLDLVEAKFYDGIIFHRVISGFMIQGGDPTGTGCGGSKKNIKGEFEANGFDNPLEHSRGVISYARSSNPNSASSQFFIMHADAPHLNGSYAAFGAVISGLENVDKIAEVKTNYADKPLVPQVIKTIVRTR